MALRPDSTPIAVGLEIVRGYLASAIPLPAAALFAEGLAILVIANDVCAGLPERRDAVLRMMVAGAAGAALINVLRIVLVAVSRDHPWTAALDYFWSARVNVQYGDLNAAGSYFAMMLFVAAALLSEGSPLWLAASLLISLALWISGSRTALAATVIVVIGILAGLVIVRQRQRRRPFVAMAIVTILTVALWQRYPHAKNASPSAAWEARVALASAALEMAANHPIFGVGLGRFHELSADYVNIPQLAGAHENAHNNFLQVLAELGVPGLVLFGFMIGLALAALARTPQPSTTTYGLLAGLVVFLITCLGGHPLLVHAVAYPFWLALGIAAAQGPPPTSQFRWPRSVGIVALTVFAATLPSRIMTAVRDTNLKGASVGLSKWQHAPDGMRYRLAGAQSALFVASAAKWVEIPLRHGSQPPESVRVQLFVDGRQANTVLLPNDGQWHILRFPLVRRAAGLYSRLDLEVLPLTPSTWLDAQASGTGDVLMVGEPVVRE
jgi:O-antigen ligase